ncbi:MAG TPA: undecaprenyl-diphosphate phosphatase, partial [Ruminiclostridium sp.]|nr:undecaprenyl-diphosphate phosphatase [Ruminiclostridium sp.]
MIFTLFMLFKSVIIGIVEGVTEFLPVSSTGHMIIVDKLIGFSGKNGFSSEFATLFEVVIQLGAILAIIVLYRKKIIQSLKTLKPGGFGFKLWTGLIVAMIPAGIIGVADKFIFKDFIENNMMKPIPVSLALVFGAIWMLFAEKRYRNNNTCTRLENVTYKQALAIGVFQCLAVVWTGFSRSASTIIGGWIMGLSTPVAAEFSFFLAIPAMIMASAGDLVTHKLRLNGLEIGSLILGFVVAFVLALVVVKKFINYIKHKPMKGFAYYRLIVGVILIILALVN